MEQHRLLPETNKPKKKPNYTARRIGAAVVALGTTVGAIKVAGAAIDALPKDPTKLEPTGYVYETIGSDTKTLWQVASNVHEGDPRDVVAWLQEDRKKQGITGPMQPGEVVRVPIEFVNDKEYLDEQARDVAAQEDEQG
jgi:hypothetical protein